MYPYLVLATFLIEMPQLSYTVTILDCKIYLYTSIHYTDVKKRGIVRKSSSCNHQMGPKDSVTFVRQTSPLCNIKTCSRTLGVAIALRIVRQTSPRCNIKTCSHTPGVAIFDFIRVAHSSYYLREIQQMEIQHKPTSMQRHSGSRSVLAFNNSV